MALASRGIVDLACVAVISGLDEAGGFPHLWVGRSPSDPSACSVVMWNTIKIDSTNLAYSCEPYGFLMDPYGDVFFFKSLPIREAYRIEQILCS